MMVIITANVLGDFLSPKSNKWQKRKQICLDTILDANPDIICVQELSGKQYKDFNESFNNYTGFDINIGIKNPLNCIWLKDGTFDVKNKLKLDLPNGSNKQKRIERYLNILELEHITSKENIIIGNTHLNYDSEDLAITQTNMITNFIEKNFSEKWVILTGDLNNTKDSKVLQKLFDANFNDTYKSKNGNFYSGPTFHAFSSKYTKQDKVDWILTKNCPTNISGACVLTDICAEDYGSDHYFVTADFILSK